MKTNWRCPYCNHDAVVHDGSYGTVSDFEHFFDHENKYGLRYIYGQVIVCPNKECLEYTVEIISGKATEPAPNVFHRLRGDKKWRLIPESEAKIFPGYIPSPLLNDYREACLIRDRSPKASATLSRRCLQGMIRDFWGVSKNRLVDEIDAIKDKVDTSTWEAIDSVRQVGNIGAHMEKDINLVIDVEPEEAQLLIGLIETLFEDWYITRHEREERMKKVKALAAAKKT